jgi:hypothetical protein
MHYLIPAIMGMLPAATARAQSFEVTSPVRSINDLGDLIDVVTRNLLEIAIPIAVLMYIWAGIKYMTSRGNPDGIKKAHDIMLYTTIGLVILLIGSGFVTLIQSILELG